MVIVPVTSAFVAIFLIALVPLTLQVGLKRISTGIFFGDGGDINLARRRAAHSNFLEHAPLFLLALALCELNGADRVWLLGIATCMFMGRGIHAFSMLCTEGTGNSRAAGMILTFLAHLGASGCLITALI